MPWSVTSTPPAQGTNSCANCAYFNAAPDVTGDWDGVCQRPTPNANQPMHLARKGESSGDFLTYCWGNYWCSFWTKWPRPVQSFMRLNATGTFTLATGAGMLDRVVIANANKQIVTLYNNTVGSGTVISAISATAEPNTLQYGVSFSIGLTAVVQVAGDSTIVWTQ